MNPFTKLFKKSHYPVSKYETVEAFVCGGVEFYQFADFNNIPALRGLKTMVYYEEFRMKCTVEYLQLHTEAIDNILTKPKINIFEIKRLNDQLKQRLDLALDTELIHKIASIVFFDKNENIEDYDFSYNAKKIENWKKNGGADFFLQQPLMTLLPILKDFPGNLKTYSVLVDQLNKSHLDSILQNLPGERMQTLNGSSYSSLTTTPLK